MCNNRKRGEEKKVKAQLSEKGAARKKLIIFCKSISDKKDVSLEEEKCAIFEECRTILSINCCRDSMSEAVRTPI